MPLERAGNATLLPERGTLLAKGLGVPMKILTHVDRLETGLDYHLARHNVLASNLANVDTPQYKARDLERVESFDAALATAMAKTDARHLGAGGSAATTRVTVDENTPADADGNSVSLD